MSVVWLETAEAGLHRLGLEPDHAEAVKESISLFLSASDAHLKSEAMQGPHHKTVLLRQHHYYRVVWEHGNPSIVWFVGYLKNWDPDWN